MDASIISFGADAPNVALTLNRVVLGLFFAIGGYLKLFNPSRHATLKRTLEDAGVHAVPVMQWVVPAVEFSAGCALIMGLLSALAAFGLFVVCLNAFLLDAIKRISAWQPINRADWIGDVLYLPEALYCVGLAIVMLAGPGPWSLDTIIAPHLATRPAEVIMSSATTSSERTIQAIPSGIESVDMKLEVVILPVSDVDRAKRFYGSLGWRLDADFTNGADWRVVQMTPPGSLCSIHFGKGLTTAAPGSTRNTYLVVSSIEAARGELARRGVDVSGAFHFTSLGGSRVSGAEPDGRSYGTYATFSDPDGNTWLLQEINTRLPGRGTSPDVAGLTQILREAEEQHGKYEATAPKHHWSSWYASYLVARVRGATPEDAARRAALEVAGGTP